jgi:hypothetical protein
MIDPGAIESREEAATADPDANSALAELAAQAAAMPAIRSRSIYLPSSRGKSRPLSVALAISLLIHAILLFGLVKWAPKFLPMMTGNVATAAPVSGSARRANAAGEAPIPTGAISIGDLQRKYPALETSMVLPNDLSDSDLEITTAPWPNAALSYPPLSPAAQPLSTKLFADPSPVGFGPPRTELFAAPASIPRVSAK